MVSAATCHVPFIMSGTCSGQLNVRRTVVRIAASASQQQPHPPPPAPAPHFPTLSHTPQCKSLAPIWSKLAHKLASIDSVVIAKMDGTENEHAKVDVQGFPTLLFFPAGEDKQPIVYSGGRDLQVGVGRGGREGWGVGGLASGRDGRPPRTCNCIMGGGVQVGTEGW